MKHLLVSAALIVSVFPPVAEAASRDSSTDPAPIPFVRVSPRDARYLELSDGTPFVPIGLNIIHPAVSDPATGLAQMERWMEALSTNGGNYLRVWLSSPFWDVEHERAGEYDQAKAERIDALIELAKRYRLRLKLTVEHFREIDPADVRQRWAAKHLHHVSRGGTAHDMTEWFAQEASRAQFRQKLLWYQERYGDEPIVFGWELWNEINAVRDGEYRSWTAAMLSELKRRFPRNLALQSLGSFDHANVRPAYRWLCSLTNNDIAQVHRYLDLGAALEVCHGPVDVLAADAVRELLAFDPGKPVILAESGGVEPRHTGPLKLYTKDTAGIILHDVTYAPFFAGGAGSGQCWHWAEYVDRNRLWPQFRAFAQTVRGVDPAAEGFQPSMIEHARLRVYALRGRDTWLIWCRDKENTWRTELEAGRAPEELKDLAVPLAESAARGPGKVQTYDPWRNRWADATLSEGMVRLPAFSRSIVVRVVWK